MEIKPQFTKDQLYGRRWKRRARLQLMKEPLCAMCEKAGKIVPAQVADHIIPHHGDINLFWHSRLQSLCWPCHSSTKQQIESKGYSTAIGIDGFPIDQGHPFFRK
jgi:5-methylcytosine-specific restriction endonuclease McrA